MAKIILDSIDQNNGMKEVLYARPGSTAWYGSEYSPLLSRRFKFSSAHKTAIRKAVESVIGISGEQSKKYIAITFHESGVKAGSFTVNYDPRISSARYRPQHSTKPNREDRQRKEEEIAAWDAKTKKEDEYLESLRTKIEQALIDVKIMSSEIARFGSYQASSYFHVIVRMRPQFAEETCDPTDRAVLREMIPQWAASYYRTIRNANLEVHLDRGLRTALRKVLYLVSKYDEINIQRTDEIMNKLVDETRIHVQAMDSQRLYKSQMFFVDVQPYETGTFLVQAWWTHHDLHRVDDKIKERKDFTNPIEALAYLRTLQTNQFCTGTSRNFEEDYIKLLEAVVADYEKYSDPHQMTAARLFGGHIK